jgi:hypothetical protein
MPATEIAANPFALLMDPASVLQAVERLERRGPKGRICRPLDKPVLGAVVVEGDDELDAEPAFDSVA